MRTRKTRWSRTNRSGKNRGTQRRKEGKTGGTKEKKQQGSDEVRHRRRKEERKKSKKRKERKTDREKAKQKNKQSKNSRGCYRSPGEGAQRLQRLAARGPPVSNLDALGKRVAPHGLVLFRVDTCCSLPDSDWQGSVREREYDSRARTRSTTPVFGGTPRNYEEVPHSEWERFRAEDSFAT